MSGCIRHFENIKNMSFLADNNVILKYSKILKKLLSVEFESQLVYSEKYMKTRVKTFEDKVITKFTDDEISKEHTHYSCIAAISVDSVIKIQKENYPKVSLEQCKFRLKKSKKH